MVRNDALILLVGELQHIHFSTKRWCIFDLFIQSIYLGLTRTKPHVYGKLRHGKTEVQQTIAKLSSRLSLYFPTTGKSNITITHISRYPESIGSHLQGGQWRCRSARCFQCGRLLLKFGAGHTGPEPLVCGLAARNLRFYAPKLF